MASSKTETVPGHFKDGLLLSVVVVLLLAVYFKTILSFYDAFSDQGAGQTHAPLLLVVSLYLIYRAWVSSGRHIQIQLNLVALVLLCLLSLVWLASGLVFVEAGQQAALILMLALLPIGLLGLKAGRKYLVPILLLLTIVPVWPVLTPYLQIMSAAASSHLLDLLGITSTRDGYLLIIPNGTFEVADACSGLKFFMVGNTLALIHTQLTRVPIRIAILYLLAASILAFVSNVLRICIVVVIGYLYGMQHEYVQDHNFIGWILFSLLFFFFLYVGERLLTRYQAGDLVEKELTADSTPVSKRVLGVILFVTAFSLGPLLYGYYSSANSTLEVDLISPPGSLHGWSRSSDNLIDWKPLWTQGDRLFQGRFRSGGDEVDLYATQFQRQSQGHEAVNVSHHVYFNQWSRISRSAKVVQLDDGTPLRVEETILQAPGYKHRLVWRWYRTNEKYIPTDAEAKLNNLIGVLRGNPDIAVYIVSKEVTKNEDYSSHVLADFVQVYLSSIDERS